MKGYTFGPEPYGFGQDGKAGAVSPSGEQAAAASPAGTGHEASDEPTGVENVRYEDVSAKGAPDNPASASETVARGAVRAGGPSAGAEALDDEEQRLNDALAGIDRKEKTLEEWIDALQPPETKEQREKREKRERSARIISAVSDGLSALGSLYFTTQYAPNMYDHGKSSQLNARNAAIEKARKDREANADKYLRFSLALGDAENERAKTVRELEAEQERRKLAREKAEREQKKAAAERALDPYRQGKAKAEQEYWEYKAATEGEDAKVAPELSREKLRSQAAQTEQRRAAAANSYASAAAHGRSNVAEFIAYDKKGKAHPFRSAVAAEAFARRNGTWQEEEYEESTTTNTVSEEHGNSDSTATTRKKRGYSKNPKQSPTAGGNGKKSPTA